MVTPPHRRRARAIEQIVRAQLLLIALALCVVAALLVRDGRPAALAAVAPVTASLVLLARVLGRLPVREFAALAQRAALAVPITFFVAIALVPQLGWYRPLTVLSGSMRPTFNPGDLILVRPEPISAVRAGQVISYQIPIAGHPLETHRVVKVLSGGHNPVVQTQGDANNWRDPWTAVLHGDRAWRLTVVVPYAGYLVNAMRAHTVHIAAVLVTPAVVALLLLAELWGVPRLRLPARSRRPWLRVPRRAHP